MIFCVIVGEVEICFVFICMCVINCILWEILFYLIMEDFILNIKKLMCIFKIDFKKIIFNNYRRNCINLKDGMFVNFKESIIIVFGLKKKKLKSFEEENKWYVLGI